VSLSAAVLVACAVTAGGALAGLAVMPRAAQAECVL
jgi:hypothetical protein